MAENHLLRGDFRRGNVLALGQATVEAPHIAAKKNLTFMFTDTPTVPCGPERTAA